MNLPRADVGTEEAIERRRLPGSIVRVVVLVFLLALVVPVVVANGDALAVPVVALASLGAIGVAVAGLVYWLLTRGLRVRPAYVLLGGGVLGVLASGAGLVWLRSQQNRTHSPIAQLDLRAAATATRLVGERDLMESLNQTGIRTMVLLGGLLVLAAVAVGAFRSAALLASTMAITGVLVEFLKTSPPPPAASLGLLTQHVTSWPSGHAALQGSLALGVVLWWWASDLPRPSILAAVVVPFAVMVGYSRAFLGIHWLSEVFAGWLVAMGAAAFVLAADRIVIPRLRVPPPARRWPVLVAGLVAAMVTVVSVHSVQRFHDRGPRNNLPPGLSFHDFDRSAPPSEPTQLAALDPASVLDPLPRYSETLLGRRVQPVNLAIVADVDTLRAALNSDGWRDADVLTPKDLAPGFWAGLTRSTKDDAPVAPTFYDTRAPDLVVQRPAGDGESVHEAEVWQLPVDTTKGCSVWVVTTSLHDRTEWDWHRMFPVRRAAPAVDPERDALARSLAAGGTLDDVGRFGFVDSGRGAGVGGSYTTDGKVALLRQPGC